MKDERNEIEKIVTFSCKENIYVYYKKCGKFPGLPYNQHKDLETAEKFMRDVRSISHPTIVEFKHPDVQERMVKITLLQARELAAVAANNIGAPFGSLAKILLANFTLDELRPHETEMKPLAEKTIPIYEQLKQEDFMIQENKDKMCLEEAQALWKTLPHSKNMGWQPSERFAKEFLLNNFTKEELEGKKGFTWEESFKPGYVIEERYNKIKIHKCSNTVAQDHFINQFRTPEQAESALAFAQLSHIVAKYNEGKEPESKYVFYTVINGSPGHGYMHVTDSNYLHKAHLVFLKKEDAETSLKVNHDLWRKYWMIET